MTPATSRAYSRGVLATVCDAVDLLLDEADRHHGLIPSIFCRRTGRMLHDNPPPIAGQRQHDRAPLGSNLLHDIDLLALLDLLGCRRGGGRYRDAADRYIHRFATHCTDTVSGLFPWGEHAFWDLQNDTVGNANAFAGRTTSRGAYHDHLRQVPAWLWQRLLDANPRCVERFAEGLRLHWKTGKLSHEYWRHAHIERPEIDLPHEAMSRDFPRYSGFFIVDCAFAFTDRKLALLARALRQAYVTAAPTVHDWWLRPIYYGWGDQVAAAMANEGVGPEGRAPRYCTQALYERWLDRLDEADVPVGTVIIDDGWSTAGSWQTRRDPWPDLPGFIARQHERGRRVLLWMALWLWEGLPDDWRLRLGDQKLTVDPTHPAYQAFIRRRVAELLSSDGCDADGFKIDQLGYVPNERRPSGGERTFQSLAFTPARQPMSPHEDLWGCELLYAYQKLIYDAAKTAKPEALITSSTVHPYFADSFDMVRLHDMGSVPADIFATMRARAQLARAALPGKPIDVDNWVHSDYEMWRSYTAGSTAIGVPCTLYAERFVLNWQQDQATRLIPLDDLRQIGDAWRQAMPGLCEPEAVTGVSP